MELLAQYGGDDDSDPEVRAVDGDDDEEEDEDDDQPGPSRPPPKPRQVTSAPHVDVLQGKSQEVVAIGSRALQHNPRYDALYAPVVGPVAPYNSIAHLTRQNTLTGYAEDINMDEFVFHEQYKSFNSRGVALDPTGKAVIGQGSADVALHGTNEKKRAEKRRRVEEFGEAGTEDFKGPWAKYVDPYESLPELTAEEREQIEAATKRRKLEPSDEREEPTFKRHIKETHDSLGHSFLEPPRELHLDLPEKCYLPKKLIHTWSGHTKGVNAIRYFPVYAHLLLSASLDGRVKLWDVHNKRNVIMTYMGHHKPARDICFTNDGRRFISASYDKTVKYWDTETGKIIHTFSCGKIPYCARINPDDDKQNEFLAGYSNKKILQWDMRTSTEVQCYDRHLGAVNTVTFVDRNRRFVSTSDDKTIRVWEYGIPVEIKYIAEPWMHSMPATCMHPNGKWILMQSLDNQILVYSTQERFRLNNKKRFAGHINAGFACGMTFSNDGRFVCSGDSEGRLWMWDWKTCKRVKLRLSVAQRVCVCACTDSPDRVMKVHDQVCIGCEWHPLESSKVATCGWDGNIKYWD